MIGVLFIRTQTDDPTIATPPSTNNVGENSNSPVKDSNASKGIPQNTSNKAPSNVAPILPAKLLSPFKDFTMYLVINPVPINKIDTPMLKYTPEF